MINLTQSKFKHWPLKEWTCSHCNNNWQLLMSPKFPERDNFKPRCDCLHSLIDEALKEDLFKSRGEAIICASVSSPIVLGRRRPDIDSLRNTIEIRRKHKKGVERLWAY